MSRFTCAAVLLLLSGLFHAPPRAGAAESPATRPAGGAAQPAYERTLRDLHAHLGRRYPNFRMKDIDWTKVGEELLPRAAGVKDDEEFGLLCMELVARLEDSHAQLLPGKSKPPNPALPQWDTGFTCLIDDRGRPVVYAVEKGSPAAGAGVRPGDAVVSMNSKPAEEALDEAMKLLGTWFGYSSRRTLRYDAARVFPRQSRQGAEVALVLEGPDGNRRELKLPASQAARPSPRLPVPVEGINESADVAWKKLGDNVGYLRVRRIRPGLEAWLDKAVRELADARGLVIDVRGNSGGGFDAARALRNFDPADPQEPERPRFKGPIALLIDERCISAGEGWSSWFVARKRAKLFGTHTAGASGRKETYTLTNGMYQVVFPIKAYTGFLDRPIERRGLEPDVVVKCNAKDLAEGKDTVLETARRHLPEN